MSVINDVLGWGLMLFGIGLILFMIYCATSNLTLLAMALSIPATFVFRSGVSFIKLNSAYRLAKKADSVNDVRNV